MADNIIAEGKIRLLCDLTGITAGLNHAKSQTTEAMGSMGGSINKTMTIAAVVAAAAGAALVKLVEHATEVGSKYHDLSIQIGMTTEQLSRLAYAATTADLTAEDMAQAVGFLSKQIVKTSQDAFAGESALSRMGIAVKTVGGQMRSTHDVLLDVARTFQHLPDGPQKTALAMELFGRAGKSMIPLLNDGADAIQALERRADELGITVSQRFAQNADEFGDQLALIKVRVGSVGRSLAEDMLPALNNVLHLLGGDFADGAVTRANQQMGVMSSLMRALSPDFDDFASKMEKVNKSTSYSEFLFSRWAADIDAAITGLKYIGPTVAAIAGTPMAFLGSTHSAAFNDAKTTKQSQAALAKEAFEPPDEGWKRGWEGIKEWWAGYWEEIDRINTEGAKALEDLNQRYGEDSTKSITDQIDRLKVQEESEAKLNHSLQLDIIRQRAELAQLNLAKVTAAVDASGLPTSEKNKRIDAARDQVRLFGDAIAVATREEMLAQGANKDLANTVYEYTKRTVEATFANEDQTRTIADTRKELEKRLAVMRGEYEARQAIMDATLQGYVLEKQQITSKAALERDVATKSIKNAEDRAARIKAINAKEVADLEALRIKEARDVENLNRDSMMHVMEMTLRGYALQAAQIEENYRKKEADARATIVLQEHLNARLTALEEEKNAELARLADQYTNDIRRALEIINEEWQTKGPEMVAVVRDVFSSMRDTVSQVFFDAITGKISDIDDAFKSLFKSILRHITDMLADQVIKQLLAWLTDLIRRIALTRAVMGVGSVAGSAAGLASEGMMFAMGGIATGGFMPLRKFASGGVATSPTIGVVGEAGMNEAMVPLPDGRNIPVKMTESQKPLNVAIALSWTSDLIQSFKTTPDEISIVMNRELMMNGPMRKNFQTRG